MANNINKLKVGNTTYDIDANVSAKLGTTDLGNSTTPIYLAKGTPKVCAEFMPKGSYVTAGQKAGTTLGDKATAEGFDTTASGDSSHAEGCLAKASGDSSHAEGYLAKAVGEGAHAEGHKTLAEGSFSHAQGNQTQALGSASAAAGYKTTAGYDMQFVIGRVNDNNESNLFEIGNGLPYYRDGNTDTGEVIDEKSFKFNSFEVDTDGVAKSESFATKSTILNRDTFNIYDEGNPPIIIPGSTASGLQSVAFGQSAEASGDASFAQGIGVKATETNQAVFGKYNAEDKDALFIVGNGDETSKSNAFQVMASGTIQAPNIQQAPDKVKDGFTFKNKNVNAAALDAEVKKWNDGTELVPYGAKPGKFAAAFGGKSAAIGKRSLAHGTTTIAKGDYSHAEGDNSVALGGASHAEGAQTVTGPDAYGAHAEGGGTQAKGNYSHAEGYLTVAQGSDSHAEGIGTVAKGHVSHAEGNSSLAFSGASHAEGESTIASGGASHAEGKSTNKYTGTLPFADYTSLKNSWESANFSISHGIASHVEGLDNIAYGSYSHAEGGLSKTKGAYAHAEGYNTYAAGEASHAEGTGAEATNTGAHAEGYQTHATGLRSHAEGAKTYARGDNSHAEGWGSQAIGQSSHAGGNFAFANNNYSFAHGNNVTADSESQAVFGKYNAQDSNALFIIGNGNATTPKNAFTVSADGVRFNGKKLLTEGDSTTVASISISRIQALFC